jgi:hypothetical protein
MRKALCTCILVAVIGVVACAGRGDLEQSWSFLAQGLSLYQRFTSDSEGALLTNDTGASVTGLRVTFSGPVAPVTGEGIGADVSVVSNADGVVVFAGDIPSYGTVSAEWPLGSAEVASAEWLQGELVAGTVDLHTPMAVMSGQAVFSIVFDGMLHLSFDVSLDGGMSRSPDGSPIVRYLWEWSDGVTQEGENASRTLDMNLGPFFLRKQENETVTLTVWNAAGESASVSHEILATLLPPA